VAQGRIVGQLLPGGLVPTAKKRSRPKRSAREIARHADQVLEEAAARARDFEKRGMRSVTLPRGELIRKLTRKTAHSPFFTQVGWGAAVRGTTFPLSFGIMNPDPWYYFEANLALCVYWGTGAGLATPGESLLLADKALGVMAIDLGTLNASPSPYYISASHVLPATLAAGNSRSEVNYFLYEMNSFDALVLLERGSLSIAIA
jgi:hypothetical protein